MRPLLLVHGTYGRSTGWHKPSSNLWTALESKGFTPIEFLWSGWCGGIPSPVIVSPDTDDLKGSLRLWQSEGEKLALFCQRLGLEAPDVISHSHGLQIVAFAASGVGGLCLAQTFGTVLSLSGPVRQDMAWVRDRAKSHIRRWVQVYDPVGDLTIREGEAFDGEVGWHYALPEADVNVEARGQGHSGLCTDVQAWGRLGLWQHFNAP